MGTPKIPKNQKNQVGGAWGSHKAKPANKKPLLGAEVKLRARKIFYPKPLMGRTWDVPKDSSEEGTQIKGVVEVEMGG